MNILNNSFRISKIKNESLHLGPKLPYLDIFKLTFQKKKLHLKQPRFFYLDIFGMEIKKKKLSYCHIDT